MSTNRRVIAIVVMLLALGTACSGGDPAPGVSPAPPTASPVLPTLAPPTASPVATAPASTEAPPVHTSVPLDDTPALAPTLAPVPADDWVAQDWRSSPPEQQDMDAELLSALVDAIRERDYDIDSVTVIRNGYMVLDEYFPPFEPDSKHVIHSCTKSIVSALIGIAIDQGYIEGVHQPVLDLFPGRTVLNLDADKEAMTLHDLLTMSSGLECRDSYLYDWRGLYEMGETDDWIQFMLDLPTVEPPGTRFEYCNGGSFLLSAMIQETTGASALEFAQEHLFGPLGISDVRWPANPAGITIGWGDMHMKPHDMAKIGYLYLNDGQWDGEQVLSADWVQASTQAYVAATLSDGYGYQWWVDGAGFYMALGYQGQFIYVVPEQEMVVVFTSALDESDFFIPETLLTQYIIPAAGESLSAGLSDDEAATLGSLERVDDYPLYTMHYFGAYDHTTLALEGDGVLVGEGPAGSNEAWACSLFSALGDADDMLYGRNFDWRYSPALLLFTDPPDGFASVSVVDIEYLGFGEDEALSVTDLPLVERRSLLDSPFYPFDGMNNQGVVIGMAAVPSGQASPDPHKETLGSLAVMREVLDHARDVDQALDILQSHNIDMEGGPALHYLVSDRSGRSALLEFYQGQAVIIPNQQPWHLATNFLRAAAGESAQGKCHRYDEIDRRLAEAEGRFTAEDALDLLAQVSQENTQWSIVYGMSSGDVLLSMGRRYDSRHSFHLGYASE